MNDIIKIGCRQCGSVLSVRYVQGIETKNVTCPVCKHKDLFSNFKRIGAAPCPPHNDKEKQTIYPNQPSNDDTEYPGHKGNDETEYPEKTRLATENRNIGILLMPETGATLRLRPGRNIVGRQAAASQATIQICPDRKRLSREHLLIEVKEVPGKGIVHYLSLYKAHVNPTFLGNTRLEFGDIMVLNHGNRIKLPDVELIFTLPDNDDTTGIL